jgi:hypothetical protein
MRKGSTEGIHKTIICEVNVKALFVFQLCGQHDLGTLETMPEHYVLV